MDMKKVMVVAGEASGDQHAADVVRMLKQLQPELEVFGFGGELLQRAGMHLELDLVSHAVIGIVEALAKLGDFFKILKMAEKLLRERRPDVLVLTDFPDLNFRIAAKAKSLGIPVVYYISPQIWAWRKGRIKTLKRIVDHMLVVFPFEEPIYKKAQIPVTFVGHPLLDLVKPEQDPKKTRAALLQDSQGPLIALLPGSRTQEIEFLLPTMAETGKRLCEVFPTTKLIIPVARTVSEKRVQAILDAHGVTATLVRDDPYSARAAADLAIVSSGTATLETAILGTPMLIGYRMKAISYFLARCFVKLPYFGLANLAAGEKIAPEFLQHEFNSTAVTAAALEILKQPEKALQQKQGWEKVRQRLGGRGAARRAAEVILRTIG
jgi:lipid-A-disaccharide synthase